MSSYHHDWDREYRGKNYSPRHRKYCQKYLYKKRSPNRSPRHLKARTSNLYFVIDQQQRIRHDNDEILLPNLPDFKLEEEELSCFRDVEISIIHSKLDEQRLENGKILAQLHYDQDQFLNICQHYQHQNDLLKEEILKYEQENESISDQVQDIQNILIQHKNENMIQNDEIRQSEIIKQHLWEAVNTNMQLLQQVNDLNKQIDSYHILIAKKSQQLSLLEKEKKEKNEKNEKKETKIEKVDNIYHNDEDRDIDTISIATFNTNNCFDGIGFGSDLESTMEQSDIIIKSYADQLILKNQRYQEILTLLRNKVDELRDTRTRL